MPTTIKVILDLGGSWWQCQTH